MRIEIAQANELAAAFQLLFQRQPEAERAEIVARALALAEKQQLEARGMLVLRDDAGLAGALLVSPLGGGWGQIWPPQVRADLNQEICEDALIQAGLAWLHAAQVKLIQCFEPPGDEEQALPLQRHGFDHVTALLILKHDLHNIPEPEECGLSYRSYTPPWCALFHETLLRTYEDTLDFPEINGTRSIEEIVAGHQHTGVYEPLRWWLVSANDRPIGVVILTYMPDWNELDLSYMGLVPEARGQGHARALLTQALHEARVMDVAQLTVTVDARNQPAWRLYQRFGFEELDRREVFLRVLRPNTI